MRPRRRAPQRRGSRACPSGKVRYPDHQSAAGALVALSHSTRAKVPVRTYACDMCRGWHLTSQALS